MQPIRSQMMIGRLLATTRFVQEGDPVAHAVFVFRCFLQAYDAEPPVASTSTAAASLPAPVVYTPAPAFQILATSTSTPAIVTAPQLQILQRPSSAASDRSNRSTGSSKKEEKTIEQRRADYAKARERIFNPSPTTSASSETDGAIAGVVRERNPIGPPEDDAQQGFTRRKKPTSRSATPAK